MRRLIIAAAALASAGGLGIPASAEVPIPTYPECGTPDRPDLCPADLDERWNLIGYVPDEYVDQVRPEELDMGSGAHVDQAWQRTTGAWDAIIAITDSGIDWEQGTVLNKHWLNPGELPFPQHADGTDEGRYDLDGSGVFNIADWAEDPRVDITAGVDDADHLLDPSDLIHGSFGPDYDGVDNDGNGYVDDIAGWDFFWNDNDPYDDTDFGHGYWEAREVGAEANDAHGNIGVCPNCALMNLRVGDSFVADGNHFAQALVYAVDNGAVAVNCALGAMTNSRFVREAADYAWEHGVVIAGSAADESAYHVMFPGGNHHVIYVNNVRYNADSLEEADSYLQMASCTNYGARVDVTAPNTGCSSRAVSVVAGMGGLIHAAAMGADGVEPLDPPLSGNEAYQIITRSADDLDVWESYGDGADETRWPMRPGWDAFSGYGRVNARAAVDMVLERRIPPEADITEPDWFVTVDPERTSSYEVHGTMAARRASSYTWTLEVAPGLEPAEEDWIEVASGGPQSEAVEGVIATFDPAVIGVDADAPIEPITVEMTNLERAFRAQIYTAWLRLRVTDDAGNVGQMRKAFYVHHDPDLLADWPVQLPGSAEASPTLADLDGDGDFEVIVATTDGEVHALDHTAAELEGWPVAVTDLIEDTDPADPANHLAAPCYGSGAVSDDVREAIVGAPAVADLDGDGAPEIVVATMGGQVFVYGADGALRDGFPVEMDRDHVTAAPLTAANDLDFGVFGSVALGDLEGDGDLEIVVPGMDQYVYAWHYDGTAVAGWPVLCQYDGSSAGLQGDRVVSTPAIGDLDGDGTSEVVVGSNESINTSYSPLYAIHHDGNDHAGGPYLEGFPVMMAGFYSETLPYVGEGSPVSPALADLDGDGDLEIMSSGMTDWGSIYDHHGEQILILGHFDDQFGAWSNARDDTTICFVHSPSFADLDGDGVLEVVDAGIGIGYITAMAKDYEQVQFDHFINAWDTTDGMMKRGFPQQVEGLQFFQNPAVADLDHDGYAEVIEGTGEFLLHAFDVDGAIPDGWPKFTGQWLMGSPAVGDLDGDGTIEVVVTTRGGQVYAWHTGGHADTDVQWQSFHHDPRNSGNASTPLPHQDGPGGGDEDDGCRCAAAEGRTTGTAALALLLTAAVGLARRRRAGAGDDEKRRSTNGTTHGGETPHE